LWGCVFSIFLTTVRSNYEKPCVKLSRAFTFIVETDILSTKIKIFQTSIKHQTSVNGSEKKPKYIGNHIKPRKLLFK